jgi:ATP-dependent 26S proteasome regulatory subunit
MEWLFGKKKTPAEMLRENKRMLDKAIRELDRERIGLQNQEKKTVAEIKKMAKEGQMVGGCCHALSQRLMHLCISSSTVTAEGVELA